MARGDLQVKSNDANDLWLPCVFARTFKLFIVDAVKHNKTIKQLDYVGAFCQGIMKTQMFIQLPSEYAELIPEYEEYFTKPLMIVKSIYGTNFAAKVWNEDLTEWLRNNKEMPFIT